MREALPRKRKKVKLGQNQDRVEKDIGAGARAKSRLKQRISSAVRVLGGTWDGISQGAGRAVGVLASVRIACPKPSATERNSIRTRPIEGEKEWGETGQLVILTGKPHTW